MNFLFVLEGKCLSDPDLGISNTNSLLECALGCVLLKACVMWSLWRHGRNNICQFSQTQRPCLEDGGFDDGACRVYEQKVKQGHLSLNKIHVQDM